MNLKSANGPRRDPHDETRRQILEAAGEVFAEAGFGRATVREICRRAGANIAAVNYHFRDKETLYGEVLRDSQRMAFEKYPPLPGVAADARPEEKLRAFVRSFLLRLFDNGPITRFGRIMSREMVEPTGALDSLLKERLRPMADLLRGIMAEILGRSPDDEQVRLCVFSVVSQCVFYHHCRTMISRLFPEQRLDATMVDRLADHITGFSLAALKHLPEAKKSKSRRSPPATRKH
ncbi:MAG TPA: CerR family C-terminal domain-containing protein [Verrucomicrobiae bacterium]|nr:CerR family C-terminal domain-containing protein [Verrucomicrobiae bacterium]